jgi:cysteine-rich repeat protein
LCIHDKTKDGTECDDNDFCTENEQCQNKVCKPFKFIDDCCHDENDCDDYDSCTNSKCDPAKHLCVYEPIVPCCGNGIKEDAEECDDKNSDETDGCSSECKFNTFILSAGLPDDRIPVASSVALSENNDRFLVVVNTFHNKSSKGEIWGKLVDLNGNTIKGLFKIDDETTESHFWPDAASGTGGGFIAAWRDGYHTRIKSITHEGDVIEKETVLQSFTAKNKPVDITELIVHRIVSVSAFHLDDTEKPFCVLVAWMQNHSDPEDSNGKNYNVHFSILKQNSEGILSIETTPLDLPSENKTFRKLNPLVLDDDNDSFLVMWTTQDSPDNDHWENRYMKIKCDGSYEKETLVKDHKGLDGIMPFLSGAFSKSKGFYLITYPFYNMKSSPGEIIISGKVLNSSLVTVKNEFEIYTEKTPALSPVSFITGDGSFISTFIILGGPTSSIINYVATDSSFTPVPVKLELTKSGDSMNFGVDTASYPEGGFFSVWLTNSNGKSHIAGRMIAGK